VLETGLHDEDSFDRLIQQLRMAHDLDAALILRVVTDACTRLPAFGKSGQRMRLDRLILCEAWTDAALSLLELELPSWRLRRLAYDGGEWLCSLSRHPQDPIEIDQLAEGRHSSMAVAILISLLEAKHLLAATAATRPATMPHVRARTAEQVCCDNFR
jgi:hypothetical protein